MSTKSTNQSLYVEMNMKNRDKCCCFKVISDIMIISVDDILQAFKYFTKITMSLLDQTEYYMAGRVL